MMAVLLKAALLLCLHGASEAVVLVEEGKTRAVICVPAEVMNAPDRDASLPLQMDMRPQSQRARLRDSVRDLAACLEKISGAKIQVITTPPDDDANIVPILIGEPAKSRFGPPGRSAPAGQGFRVVITPQAIGLIGESDLGASYAIYELLHRLGCRWYMPTAMGECLPESSTIALPVGDESSAPFTHYRGLWFCDDDYVRRNRMGGLYLSQSHALDSYVSKELLEKNPQWAAVINGKPRPPTLKWTPPAVADAIADTILQLLDRGTYTTTVSLSPEDGMHWDESEDPKHDAGDFDPTFNYPAVTDRLLILANRVAEKVTVKYPDVRFGMIIYSNYTRPPLREKLHPNIVPVIAPISYSRNHPVTDEGEPNNKDLRRIFDEWGKLAQATGVYFYLYNLAEEFAPNPMIAKMSVDVPYVLNRRCRYFTPESSTNFNVAMHGLYLSMRLAWDPAQDSAAIIHELNARFYGPAAEPMAEYWKLADDCWVTTDEYSGSSFGHMRRFTPQRMAKLRELLNQARALAGHARGVVLERVQMADETLILHELYMKMRHDLTDGRWDKLGRDAEVWVSRNHAMAERYRAQSAFSSRTYGAGGVWGNNNGVDFFEAFWKPALDDATRIARHEQLLTSPPLRQWRFVDDPQKKGHELGWSAPAFDDSGWRNTDVAAETWSTLGHHNYFGRMWYRTTATIPAGDATRRTYLWVGSADGSVKVFLNGKHVPFIDAAGASHETFTGFAQPASFDISAAFTPDQPNQITLQCDRDTITEVGVGGLLAPVAIYRER